MTTVVLATSGSPACQRALARLPEVFGPARVVVATAVPGDGAARVVRAALDALAVDAAESVLAAACDVLGSPARPVLLRGDPVDRICELARTAGADVLVVGSLGGHGVAAAADVGPALRHRAPCPVVELGV